MLQTWEQCFNPNNPSKLAFPTWVTLQNMPYEHNDHVYAIVETLGEIVGIDTSNEITRDLRFCINVTVSKGWVTRIDLASDESGMSHQGVLVDYDNLPIRCRSYHSWKHKVWECNENR